MTKAQAVTKEEVDAALNETNLRVAKALADLTVAQKEAEARKAIAEAEKAELAAKLPTTETKLLGGSVNTEKFGAAALVKAFDLARTLASEVCTEVSKTSIGFVLYEPTAVQGMVSARAVQREIDELSTELKDSTGKINKALNPQQVAPMVAPLVAMGAIVTGVKAAADLASLFKVNVTAAGTSYGDGTKGLFATAMLEQCPKLKGLGTGYLGELDDDRYKELRDKFKNLVQHRSALSEVVDKLKKKLEDKTLPEAEKQQLTALNGAATLLLKTADAFVDTMKVTEVSDKSPLFNAARYLAYEQRTKGADVLDFDLRLEGLAITRENIFTGQHLNLSGVAFLTYRFYKPDGSLKQAKTIRRITKPIEVKLKGEEPTGEFWSDAVPSLQN
jgi:hypothetical protein